MFYGASSIRSYETLTFFISSRTVCLKMIGGLSFLSTTKRVCVEGVGWKGGFGWEIKRMGL